MLKVRPEQLESYQPVAEAAFELRVKDYLLAEHGEVLIESRDAITLRRLSDDSLLQLIRDAVRRARDYGMTWESTLTAFVTLTFVVSKNFDDQPAIRRVLFDDKFEANLRIDHLWEQTTDEDWAEAAQNWNSENTSTDSGAAPV